MFSRFLERDIKELNDIAHYIRSWIDTLTPLYVSDHLAQFTIGGRRLPLLAELNYAAAYPYIKSRIITWQNILNCPIAFENFPSTLDINFKQLDFYNRLLNEVNCQLLFDFSNAKIAEINCAASALAWKPLIRKTNNFHVAGFRMSTTRPSLAVDTHDVPINNETIAFMKKIMPISDKANNKTIVVERDANIDYLTWKQDLLMVRNIVNHQNGQKGN